MEHRGTGALPPSEHQWQVGKTAGLISFVRHLEGHQWMFADENLASLNRLISGLKNGTISLETVLTRLIQSMGSEETILQSISKETPNA